ncbi:hypothetical protein BKK81_33525 (plasmid) [Cupriavidus sp. USMAHM13]|uniref:hypothetical protein n=1 Tax=Cupriavidus sp. USMAHM13 TaxID=1389192 RepID=UPI0008A67F2C|nr:hypothetical protein [Cupriavidus sp. USMAHM13]AOZ04305.1 hypothetical protein BKK81_33525 [Cupriavidus sp. USMAHM13]
MKRRILAATASALVLSSMPVLAQQPPAAQAKPAAPNVQEFDKQMAQAQENMKKMQEQMDKIRQTQDPQARQKLLQEHWDTMQANMQLMHNMWGPGGGMGPGMMGRGPGMLGGPMMGWGHMGGYYAKLTPEQQRQRQYMRDQYMPMQQMMMDHMMQHQQWMWQSPLPK